MKSKGIWKFLIVFGAVILFCLALLFGVRFFKRGSMLSSGGSLSCTLSIRCDTVLNNMDRLNPEKRELIPEDGVLLREKNVGFDAGESVFDVLYRAVRDEKIHMEFSDSALYGSVYIEGIGNLYEFDCGELSGWMYSVNGEFPMYGMSQYEVKDGDVIEVVYTCDLGADVGNSFEMGE